MDIAEFIFENTLLFILMVTLLPVVVIIAGIVFTSRSTGRLIQQSLPSPEQWAHFSQSYPWNPRNFRALDGPVDGVQCEDDMIALVEYTSPRGRLSGEQRRIRRLAEKGRVEFREVAADPSNPSVMRVR